jgi:hypothetical protein
VVFAITAPLIGLGCLLVAIMPVALGEVAIYFIVGTLLGHTTLAAAWLVFGPLPLIWRLLLSSGWLALLQVALSIDVWLHEGSQSISWFVGMLLLVQWLMVQIVLWGLVRALGWRLEHSEDDSQCRRSMRWQFGLRQLMICMLLLAVALGIGRLVAPQIISFIGVFIFSNPEFALLPAIQP